MAEIDTSNMSQEEIAELQKQNCIFCKIAEKQIPAKILHEDDKVMCILDINPASEGHILVYPKDHYMILPHIPDDLLTHLFKVTRLMSNTLLKALQSGGTSVFIANGMAAGQKAPHVLIHVFPRKMNDGLLKLPRYDMNDEQKKKLKTTLKPYLNQAFGPSKTIKEEEIEKKIQKHDKEEKKEKQNEDIHPAKTEDGTKVHKTRNTRDKNDEENRDAQQDNKKNVKKIDLDDIAKLFGG